jgi:glycosyltransferase involved in cell wall biosynthesis
MKTKSEGYTTVVRLEKNAGKAMALNAGFHKARELDPDAIVTMDGDYQHLPEALLEVCQRVLKGEAEMQFLAHEHHLTVCEVPITFATTTDPSARSSGRSSFLGGFPNPILRR